MRAASLSAAGALSAVALLAGCMIVGGTLGTPSTDGVTPATMADVARSTLAEVNRVRESRGISVLIEDEALNRAAREHSVELAGRRDLDHMSRDPARRTMTMRIEAAGATWVSAAENLAAMSGSGATVPEQTVRMWLGSDGHRNNMLSRDFTHTGVGVAVDGRGHWYVTQLYVLPRADR